MNRFQPVVLAVLQKDDRYLLTLRHDQDPAFNRKWQLPGGSIEFGEAPEEALHREVREELGIEVKIVRLIPFVDTRVRGTWQGIFISFLCTMTDESANIYLNKEATAWRWFEKKELDYSKLDILVGCVEIIYFPKLEMTTL